MAFIRPYKLTLSEWDDTAHIVSLIPIPSCWLFKS